MSPTSLLVALVVALVALAGAGTPVPGRVSQLVTDFGLRLFRAALGPRGDTNVVLAPHGATSVLVALQMATAGRGRRQLEEALGFSIDAPGVSAELRELRRALQGGSGQGLAVAEGLFVGRGVALTPGFARRALRALGPRSVARVDFTRWEGARTLLDSWVRERTKGLLGSLVPPGALGPRTRLVVASAQFLRGGWATPFPPRATRARPFRRADGSDVAVPMMARAGTFRCGEFETPAGVPYSVVEVPYEGGAVSMLLVAPLERDDPIVTLTHLLDGPRVTHWVTNLSPAPRLLVLPRFSLETTWDLRPPLKSLGVLDLFDPEAADFTPLSGEEHLVLGQALQRVRMEVTENGTEVASATAAIVYSRMAPLEIILDRPFLFLIRHGPTGTILFVGQVTEP
ncbi:plasminogen activator inhibitor 1 [Manacus candei]|uniref:plasminogen activator inhibitor 1 n=1 Tax=Manacus candei TaxID=415023 RepID=UPI0022267B6A|nr:plasminogen activator inhibitor 1 [Manacus candei]